MTQPSIVERIAESLTLARAQRVAESTAERTRQELASELALGRQKADAAEALFDNGHPSEAIKLARDAFQHTLRAVETLAPPRLPDAEPAEPAKAEPENEPDPETKAEAETKAEPEAKPEPEAKADPETKAEPETKPEPAGRPEAPWRRTLRARGTAIPTLDAIEAVLDATRASAAPRLDEDVKPEDAAAFHKVLAARVAVDREVHAAALSPAQIRAQRRNRVAGLVVVLAALVVGLFFLLHTPTGTFASASEHFGGRSEYAPENAIDGRPDTEWILPDRVSGWLEVRVSPPRRVEAVTLLNAHNPPMNDRATRDYTLEVYANGELARTVDGSFAFSQSPEPVRQEVGVDGVERVRVVVRSSHQYGGGLAEVTLE